MKKVMVFLDDDTASVLKREADRDYRSVKSMAEKIIIERVKRVNSGQSIEIKGEGVNV